MKVTFKQICANSGVDIWAENLSKEVNRQGVPASVEYFPSYIRFLPFRGQKSNPVEDRQIIHTNISYGSKLKTDNPLIVTEHHLVSDSNFISHASFTQRTYYRYVEWCEKKSLNVADEVTCVSNYTKEKLEEVYGYYDAQVIYNGIDTKFFSPKTVPKNKYGINDNSIVLFFAGNLIKRKGADLLPRIMKKLDDKYMLLVTSGLNSNIKLKNGNILYLGNVTKEKLVEAYNLSDIYLFPTRLEGFGLTVAEAMGCEKPVVTTDCSSLPELVVDGKGGFLCEKDNINDFVEKISLLGEDINLRKEMGRFNRKYVEKNFTSEMMGAKYIKLYSQNI